MGVVVALVAWGCLASGMWPGLQVTVLWRWNAPQRFLPGAWRVSGVLLVLPWLGSWVGIGQDRADHPMLAAAPFVGIVTELAGPLVVWACW